MFKHEYLYIPLFMLMTIVVVLVFFLFEKDRELEELELRVRAYELGVRAKEEKVHQLEQELAVLVMEKKKLKKNMEGKGNTGKEVMNDYIKMLEEENAKLREQVLILKDILDYEKSFSKERKKMLKK